MGVASVGLLAFNRGRISPLALARTDFKRTAWSAEVMTNWMPRSLGAMTIRSGLEYTGMTRSNEQSLTIPFIYSKDDMARLELTSGGMRVWINDALITRPAVTAAVTNGTFSSDLTGWSDQDSGGASSVWATGGYLSLAGTETGAAKRRQQVTVNEPNIVHALNVIIIRGTALIRVGSSAGADDYVSEANLQTGHHSLAFTPTGGSFWVDIFSYERAATLVDTIDIATSGAMVVPKPWAPSDFPYLRWDQSGDVVFVATSGYRQQRIERRPNNSWSIVDHTVNDGPFRVQNVGPISIAPSGVNGDVTLAASQPLFKTGHVGALFRLEQTGQTEEIELTGDNQFSDPIRVTGVDGTRVFGVLISGSFTATVTLQYSVGDPGDWIDAPSGSYTEETFISYDDTLDNQVIYYRIGIKSGGYGSGTANATLSYSSGSQSGIARITGFTSSTSVSAAVIESFGNTSATTDWWESYWSPLRGFPSAVALHEGRLWWAGKDRIWGSVSDGFSSHDDTVEGDSAPISRSIGSGPVDNIPWLMSLQRLIMGGEMELRAARSSSLDEPLTVSNFNLKSIATDGSEQVAPVKIGGSAIYASGPRMFEVAYDAASYDYGATEISQVVPEIGEPGIVKIIVQHRPEKRVHAIRSDGTAAILVYLKQEDVAAWIDIETDGFVEDGVVLPGTVEDSVYYTVRRTIDDSTVRYHEKFALESECRGFPVSCLADSFYRHLSFPTTTITGLDHLEGQEVVCWGWNTSAPFLNSAGDEIGRDMGTFTVSGGQITDLPDEVTSAIVGLPYDALYKSSKLAYADDSGVALTRKKHVSQLGLIGRWLHASGLRYGPSLDVLDPLPMVEKARIVDVNEMRLAYDEESMPLPGQWDTDTRLCLKASAPRPATVLAAVIAMETNVK